VRIARRLGVRYLWIVALCILLDSPSDWDKETLAMADIYRGAYCNIAATGATDGNVGLSHDRNVYLLSDRLSKFNGPIAHWRNSGQSPKGETRERGYTKSGRTNTGLSSSREPL